MSLLVKYFKDIILVHRRMSPTICMGVFRLSRFVNSENIMALCPTRVVKPTTRSKISKDESEEELKRLLRKYGNDIISIIARHTPPCPQPTIIKAWVIKVQIFSRLEAVIPCLFYIGLF